MWLYTECVCVCVWVCVCGCVCVCERECVCACVYRSEGVDDKEEALSSELGTYKTVKARFWLLLEPFSGKGL